VLCAENRTGKEGDKVLTQSRSAANSLHLNGQTLADEGVPAICGGLLFNNSVRNLSLNSNRIGKVGAVRAADLSSATKPVRRSALSATTRPVTIESLRLHKRCYI
jgi:hypothetical protein